MFYHFGPSIRRFIDTPPVNAINIKPGMNKSTLAISIFALLAPAAHAGTLTFDFTYANTVYPSMTAVGQLQIDSAVLANILTDTLAQDLPTSDLESLSITVSGQPYGNGTFTLADFTGFVWWSAGATFNYTQNWVGQSMTTFDCPCVPWATGGIGDLNGGDFDFFSDSSAPTYSGSFDLQIGGGLGYTMYLTSLEEVSDAPEPASIALVGLGGLAMLISRRRGRLSL
jgi:hypothetical protein